MTRIDLHQSSKLTFAESSAPSTPAAGLVYVYAKSDGLLYQKDDAGTETLVAGGAGLSNPMTTAEDIIVGGASGTPARLAVGTEGQVLSVSSGAVAWAAAGGGFTTPVAPGQVAYVKAATNYTTTSDTFADVDGTNITITKTFTGARHARICVALTGQSSVATGAIGFDIDIDGTRLLNTTYGLVFNMGNTGAMPISFCLITSSALTAGSHTFKLQWRKVGAITATAWGSGVYPVVMNVEELAS